jgi:hypothetical protein
MKILKTVGKNKRNRITVLCECDCGKQFVSMEYDIKRGHTRSCGCLLAKTLSERRDEKHPMWKDSKKMGAIHHWVKLRKQKPLLCENCGERPAEDCANISGEYKRDLSDYEWLCRKCHQEKDGRMKWWKRGPRDQLGRLIGSYKELV